MDIVSILAHMLDRLLRACIHAFSWFLNGVETGLRGPLDQSGIHGALQTLIITMIPILCLVAAVKLFGGLFRLFLLAVCVLILAHIMLPILMGGTVRAA